MRRSAFPQITPDMIVDGQPGMSLRDWFAGQALVGLLAASAHPRPSISSREAATEAYLIADAMMRMSEA